MLCFGKEVMSELPATDRYPVFGSDAFGVSVMSGEEASNSAVWNHLASLNRGTEIKDQGYETLR